MDTARPTTRCPVYLHPTAANPSTIRSIQLATGQLIVLAGGRPQLKQPTITLPAFEDFGPWGGAA